MIRCDKVCKFRRFCQMEIPARIRDLGKSLIETLPFLVPVFLLLPSFAGSISLCSLVSLFEDTSMASHIHVDPAHMLPAYLAQSQVGVIYAAVITGSVLMTSAVPLRFVSRSVANAPLWWYVHCMLVSKGSFG